MKIRGFEKLNDLGIIPTRATINSAGYDFYVPEDIVVKAKTKVGIKTYICSYMQSDEYLAIHIRSSISIKKGLELVNQTGIVDSDYYHNPDNNGHIIIWVKNTNDTDVELKRGDRIAQGIFNKYLKADDDNVKYTRIGGFGSTTKE
ncbi:MAG: dUTP diphosphatase [Bacilli bacterium]|nr:dUTP diphosphatase [Bacilli bacterium]